MALSLSRKISIRHQRIEPRHSTINGSFSLLKHLSVRSTPIRAQEIIRHHGEISLSHAATVGEIEMMFALFSGMVAEPEMESSPPPEIAHLSSCVEEMRDQSPSK